MPNVMTQLIDNLNQEPLPTPRQELKMIVTMGTFTKSCTTDCPSIQDLLAHCKSESMHPAALFFSPAYKDALNGQCVEFSIRLYKDDQIIGEHIDTIR
jgi:hypothetical protein